MAELGRRTSLKMTSRNVDVPVRVRVGPPLGDIMRSKQLRLSYLRGIVITACLFGIAQDFVSLDAYLAWAKDHWLVLPYWVWVPGVLACIIYQSRAESFARYGERIR